MSLVRQDRAAAVLPAGHMSAAWRAVFTAVALDLIAILGERETKIVFAEVVRRGPQGGTAAEWSLVLQEVLRQRGADYRV